MRHVDDGDDQEDEGGLDTSGDENTTLLQGHSTGSIQEQDASLRRVRDSLPVSAWLIAVIEGCERFAYYGISGPLQNYIQNSHDDPLRPGLIGLGQANATRLNLAFLVCNYMTPILGAAIADQYLGRYKTIVIASLLYIVGSCILVLSSVAFTDNQHLALAALLLAMVFIAFGNGGIKSNTAPLVAEQYQRRDALKVLRSGETVVVDYDWTIQSIFMLFYVCIQLGAISALVTTELEYYYGFSVAFLLPLFVFSVGLCILISCRKIFIIQPPDGSALLKAITIFRMAIHHGWNLEATKSSYQERQSHPMPVSWDDTFVDELRRTIKAWKIFAFFPFYFLAYSQTLTNFISQAATMETHGTPNDIWFNMETLSVLCLVPLLNNIALPALSRCGIVLRPTSRITLGFMFMSSAMAYAAIVQNLIYQAPPCYQHPLKCQGGRGPNQVHVALQIPAYILMGVSGVFAISSGYEYAFTHAPQSMRSITMASFLVTFAGGALLGIAITPLTADPRLTWMYSGLGVMCFVAGGIFWFLFGRENGVLATTDKIERNDDEQSIRSGVEGAL